jgi:hypothetical protein
MTYGSQPSLTLCELWERQSAKGNVYYSGYWGGLQVALLRDGERPHPTRPGKTVVVWRLVASERQPRDTAPKAAARPAGRDEAPMPLTAATSGAGARPDGPQAPQRRFRREGAAAQRERVSAEIAAGLGVHDDGDLNDEIGF